MYGLRYKGLQLSIIEPYQSIPMQQTKNQEINYRIYDYQVNIQKDNNFKSLQSKINQLISKMRRNRIGTKASQLWGWDVQDIKKMTGPLAVQQYIQQMIRSDPSAVQKIIQCPQQIDINLWKYQQVRQFVLELNLLVTTLKDLCNKNTCPTMKGSKQSEYRCAAHKTSMDCSAIDYMIHNLDQSTSILLNIKNYANRASISQTKHLDTIVRRLYRLFSHTYHFHEQIFIEFEKHMYLCERFTKFTVKNGLLDEGAVNIPETAFIKK